MPTVSAETPHQSATPVATGVPPSNTTKSFGGSNMDVMGSFRRHRFLALAVMLIVILLGLPVAWIKGTPKYSATAVIFVSPRFVANLEDGREQDLQSNSQYREYVQQNVRTINRYDIVLEALKRIGPLRSVWVHEKETLERAATRLQGDLAVEPVPDTYQISVSLESNKKAGLAELVNAVVTTYLEKAKTEEFYASDQRIQNLIQDRTRLQQEVNEKQARRLTIAQELGVSSFTESFINPYDRLLVTAKESLSDARKQQIEASAQLQALDDKQHTGGAASLHAFALDQAAKDPVITSLAANLNLRRTQLLTSMSGLSPDHPGRRAAERELAELNKQEQEVQQKSVDSYAQMVLEQKRADVYRTAEVEQKLRAELDRQVSQAAWFTHGYQEGIQLGLDIERARKRFDTIQQRIDFLSLEKSAPGFVRMFSSARPPDVPVKGGRKKLFAIFFVAALFLGVGVPVGVDMLDPRIHSPRDVEKVLGFSPMAWLLEKKEAGPDFAREQVLRLANRISQDQQNNNSRIFAFTSVKARGGTSTLVIETAQALGHLGVPALAVEANAYRSDPRYRKPNSRGLAVLLTGNQDLSSAVVASDDEMPDRIPVGDLLNEKSLPDIQNLIEVLKQAADAYPVVLVDVPPILVSVDAEYIARTSDVAVLVVEAESVSKAELQRAARSLERLRVPAVSAIVNRVRTGTAGGFGAAALYEFETGSAAPPSSWLSPWLWK